jgi:hypothetical protein
MGDYDDDEVDARWYLDHQWPHDAADELARPGAMLRATAAEFRLLKPLIEQHDLSALYLDGEICVFTHDEAAELLRELELGEGRRGPAGAPPPSRAGRTRRLSR